MKANDLSKFCFKKVSSGAYRVWYFTERGDYYVARIEDMMVIDNTKNAEWAKCEDIEHLRNQVKRRGRHYHKDGSEFGF